MSLRPRFLLAIEDAYRWWTSPLQPYDYPRMILMVPAFTIAVPFLFLILFFGNNFQVDPTGQPIYNWTMNLFVSLIATFMITQVAWAISLLVTGKMEYPIRLECARCDRVVDAPRTRDRGLICIYLRDGWVVRPEIGTGACMFYCPEHAFVEEP